MSFFFYKNCVTLQLTTKCIIKFVTLLVKFNFFATILNTQNMQETDLYLNNPHMCWLDKSFASEY
jgi:hypothetical protein